MKKKLRVLIVEDSEADAELLVLELKRGGYIPEYERVETAETMSTALTFSPLIFSTSSLVSLSNASVVHTVPRWYLIPAFSIALMRALVTFISETVEKFSGT